MTIRSVESGLRESHTYLTNSDYYSNGEIGGGVRAAWGLAGGLGPAPRNDSAAHAAIRDRVLHTYSDNLHNSVSGVDYWQWDYPPAYPMGINPLNSITSVDYGGFNGSLQRAIGSDGIIETGNLSYEAQAATCSFNLRKYFDTSYYAYWWSGAYPYWRPGQIAPYNDYPYGTTVMSPTMGNPAICLGGRLKVYAPVPSGSPPGLAAFMGNYGDAGQTWDVHFAGMISLGSWTPGAIGTYEEFTLGGAAIEASLTDDFFLNFTFPDQDLAAGTILPEVLGIRDDGFSWEWTGDGYGAWPVELELDFESPTFDAARYAQQYAAVTVNVCDPYFFGDSVSTG